MDALKADFPSRITKNIGAFIYFYAVSDFAPLDKRELALDELVKTSDLRFVFIRARQRGKMRLRHRLDLRQDFTLVKVEKAVLVSYLMNEDVVVAGIGVFFDCF